MDDDVLTCYKKYNKIFKDKNIPFNLYKVPYFNFSEHNNFLADIAIGDTLLFMNDDIFLTYDAISHMSNMMNTSNNDIGCLGHRLVFAADPNVIQHDGQILYDQKTGNWKSIGHHNYGKLIQNTKNNNIIVEGVTAAFLMIKKTIFKEVNGFNEEYKDIFQDVDLNLKVAALGYDNICIRTQSILHVDHSSRKTAITPEAKGDFEILKTTWHAKGKFIKGKLNAT
jgi:GT2 family glycosyltransferase